MAGFDPAIRGYKVMALTSAPGTRPGMTSKSRSIRIA
jgi:hypothetical protein